MQHAPAMQAAMQQSQQNEVQGCVCYKADWDRRCQCGRPLICSVCKKAHGQKVMEVVTQPLSTHCVGRAFCPYGPRKGRAMPVDVELYYQEYQGRKRLSEEWEAFVSLSRPPMYTGDEERMRDRGGRTQVLLSGVVSIKRYTSVENLDFDDLSMDASSSSYAEPETPEVVAEDEEVEDGEEDLATVNFVYSRCQLKDAASHPQSRNLRNAVLAAAQSSMDEFEQAWEALVTHFAKRGLKDVKAYADVGSIQREAKEKELSAVETLNEFESNSRTLYQSRILRESFICIFALQTGARMLVPKPSSSSHLSLSRFPTAMSDPSDFISVPSNA